MISESESVRDILNSFSTIKFRVDQPGSNRLLLTQRAVWFVRSPDRKDPRNIGPLKAVWKDQDGAIWLETSEIDDMMSLVEREYGEKGVHEFPYVEPGVAPSGTLPDEVARFPRVVSMLKACEEEVAEVSQKTGIGLKIIYDGGTGVTTFRVAAKIPHPPTDEQILRQIIGPITKALKEAHDMVLRVVWARWDDSIVDTPRM